MPYWDSEIVDEDRSPPRFDTGVERRVGVWVLGCQKGAAGFTRQPPFQLLSLAPPPLLGRRFPRPIYRLNPSRSESLIRRAASFIVSIMSLAPSEYALAAAARSSL